MNILCNKHYQRAVAGLSAAALIVLSVVSVLGNFSDSRESILHIDRDDSADSVYHKLRERSGFLSFSAFRLLAAVGNYERHLHVGCYDVGSGHSTLNVFRRLRNGSQTPIRLTIPILRTPEDLSDFLGKTLHDSPQQFLASLTDSTLLAQYGKRPETAVCLFIPNTYEVYWSSSPQRLIEKMHRESRIFWNNRRLEKARQAGLSEDEVLTLASIVEQETADNAEKPTVAGMYLNRLRKSMPLQADPTVKFALREFGLRRILHKHLTTDSPYNTYKNRGLPPGPICIPSQASIDAVLNHVRHEYIYMCAKEDFSGSHNFAITYAEHLQNAKKYIQALDRRGIR